MRANTIAVPYANVIFDHARREALEEILRWLEQYGLEREEGDVAPTTRWESGGPVAGKLALAGRYGQWKYYWSDDCVLRGAQLAGLTSSEINTRHMPKT